MKRTIAAATVAVGALALSACTPTESGAKPEPAPAETVSVEDDWTESDDFIELAMELTWSDTSAEEREDICWGIDTLGETWFLAIWDEDTSGTPAPLAYEFLAEKCS